MTLYDAISQKFIEIYSILVILRYKSRMPHLATAFTVIFLIGNDMPAAYEKAPRWAKFLFYIFIL